MKILKIQKISELLEIIYILLKSGIDDHENKNLKPNSTKVCFCMLL